MLPTIKKSVQTSVFDSMIKNNSIYILDLFNKKERYSYSYLSKTNLLTNKDLDPLLNLKMSVSIKFFETVTNFDEYFIDKLKMKSLFSILFIKYTYLSFIQINHYINIFFKTDSAFSTFINTIKVKLLF
jgi:hypothetical protein